MKQSLLSNNNASIHNGTFARMQQGATLISLMIGLLLSVMSILAVLSLYKNLVTISINSSTDSSHDGQLAAAVLTAQLELQNAGYGIKNAGALHINANSDGSEIRWRLYDDSNYQCRAIREVITSDTVRELVLFEATNNCTENSALPSLDWTRVSTLTRVEHTVSVDKPLITFGTGVSNCSPFGLGENTKHMIASIKMINSANFHSGNTTGTDFTLCLASTHPA